MNKLRDFLFSALHDPTDNSWSSTRICASLSVVVPVLCAMAFTVASIIQQHSYAAEIGALLGGGGLGGAATFLTRTKGP